MVAKLRGQCGLHSELYSSLSNRVRLYFKKNKTKTNKLIFSLYIVLTRVKEQPGADKELKPLWFSIFPQAVRTQTNLLTF